MAVTFGAITTREDTAATTPETLTGPTVSGADTLGIVIVGFRQSISVSGNSLAVTWGGSAMTLIVSGSSNQIHAFEIDAPSSAGTISVSWDGTTAAEMGLAALYVTGADSAGQSAAATASNSSTVNPNITAATTSGAALFGVARGHAESNTMDTHEFNGSSVGVTEAWESGSIGGDLTVAIAYDLDAATGAANDDYNATASGTFSRFRGLIFEITEASAAQTISPSLVSQLLAGVDPVLTTGNVNLSPALESQLLAGVDPAITTGNVDLTPSLISQLLAGVDPAITTGNVNLSPSLVSQLLAGVDPVLTVGTADISPSLVSQLLAGVDPSITTGNVNLSPSLVSQLLAAVDPIVTGGAALSLAAGFDVARFYRHNISGSERLILVVGFTRGVASGFGRSESWDVVSGAFALPAEPRYPASKKDATNNVFTAWDTNKTDTQAVLTAALNSALTTAGYTRPNGEAIG